MRCFFKYKSVTVPSNIPTAPEFEGDFMMIHAVTGVIEMSLGDGEYFPVYRYFKFRLMAGESFSKVVFKSTAGGSVQIFYGRGDISLSSATESGGEKQIYSGVYSNPNGNFEPADLNSPALYYKDGTELNSLWLWSVSDQLWFAAIQ